MTRTSSWWRRRASVAGLLAGGAALLGCALGADMVTYDLPPEGDRYTLTVETAGVETAWEFYSDRSQETDALPEQYCLGQMFGLPPDGDCRVEPLIFLKYDLSLELDNTVAANRPHEITVTAYHQQALTERPAVTDLQVEVSYDSGATWSDLAVSDQGDGVYTVRPQHPRSAVGDGVWLRVSATDDQGNSVVQTKPDVFRVR